MFYFHVQDLRGSRMLITELIYPVSLSDCGFLLCGGKKEKINACGQALVWGSGSDGTCP
jgi:hypothetical protein